MTTEESTENLEEAKENESEVFKELVLKAIAEQCNPSSKFEFLQDIHSAVKQGDQLICKTIAGGETNISYKVFLEKDPSKAVYAKLCFGYALWNPDAKLDLIRTENEFEIMAMCCEILRNEKTGKCPVATPYLLVDIEEADAKLVVTEWCSMDATFGSQYTEGQVDPRVVREAASTLAVLNLQTVRADFNDGVRASYALAPMKQAIAPLLSAPDDGGVDACIALLKEFGKERVEALLDANDAQLFGCKEVLCHNDFHQFNILVEPKLGPLREFGETGAFVFCDWEMSICGPAGKDAGHFQVWPLACVMRYAVQGQKEVAFHLFQSCVDFFDGYAKVLVETGEKDHEYLKHTFRNSVATTGAYLFLFMYMLGNLREFLPLPDLAETDAKRAKGAMGFVGLQCLAFAHEKPEEEMDLSTMYDWYKNMVTSQIETLTAMATSTSHHDRPGQSICGASRCLVSDATTVLEAHTSLSHSFSDDSVA